MIGTEKLHITIPSREVLNYSTNHGAFSVSKPTKKGFTHSRELNICRETFSRHFKENTDYIVFSQSNIDINIINDFFGKIESKLDIKNKTIFSNSNKKNFIIIRLSPFWKENSLRRGIFTLFLRCAACHYDGNDVYKALLKYSLTKKIIGVLEWFMKGNTRTQKKIYDSNVVSELSTYSRPDWESILVK
jgi:hypothetical protein